MDFVQLATAIVASAVTLGIDRVRIDEFNVFAIVPRVIKATFATMVSAGFVSIFQSILPISDWWQCALASIGFIVLASTKPAQKASLFIYRIKSAVHWD